MFITPTNIPLLVAIKQHEFNNFTKAYENYNPDATSFDSFHDGQVLVPIQLHADPINNLLTFSGAVSEHRNPKSVYPLFSNVTDKILTLDNKCTIAQALTIVNTYINKAKNNFYGVILRNGSELINPFHPLTALQILSNYDSIKNNVYTVIMYFYTNRQAMNTEYSTPAADIDKINSIIDNLIRSNSKAVVDPNTAPMRTAVVPHQQTDSADIEYYTTMNLHNPLPLAGDSFIVAHQFMTKGVVAPYYASSILELPRGQDAKGIHVTPLLSCNISYNGNSDVADARPIWNSVCTGRHANSIKENLRVLTHANLSSPFNTHIVHPGALVFIDRCIDRVRELYTKVGILSSYTPITDFTSKLQCPAPEELYARFYNSSESDFIDHLTATMAASHAFTLLQQIKDYHNAITQSETQSSSTADATRSLPNDTEPVNGNPNTDNTITPDF